MNISFALTIRQFKNRSKDVTRRLGWAKLTNRTILTACEKCQGLKKGEHVKSLGKIATVTVWREPLDRMLTDVAYGGDEVKREGFPELTPAQFVEMFCEHNGCKPSQMITRIQFEYL